MRPHGKVDRFFHQCASGNTDDQPDGYMKTKELEPQQLFIDLALLICEARQPELSERGRVQGPHCPQVGPPGGDQVVAAAAAKANVERQKNKHVCDGMNETCIRARQIESELGQLWSRCIPACLTVSLLPDECSKQENCIAESLVLEKWTIQQLERRAREDKLLPGQFLMQAVRSHLHFSQLSAWLIASRGKHPTNIVYRVCLPGESETRLPTDGSPSVALQKHRFPFCSAGKNLCLSVIVESMPRCENIPVRSCYCLRPSTSGIGEASETPECGTGESTSGASDVSLCTSSLARGQVDAPLRATEDVPCVVIGEKGEIAEDADASPLDSRSNSYQSFCDERSRSPPDEGIQSSSSHSFHVPSSLPHSVYASPAQPTRKHTYATNPLFESPAVAPPMSSSNKYLNTRVGTSSIEARLLRAELYPLSSATTAQKIAIEKDRLQKTPCSLSNAKSRSSGIERVKPRFFVSDDDENDEQEDERSDQGGSCRFDGVKRTECKGTKRILFSDEKAVMTNDGNAFSEWIDPPIRDAYHLEDESAVFNEAAENKKESCDEQGTAHISEDSASCTSSSRACSTGQSRKVKRMLTFGGADGGGVQFHPKTGLPLSSSPAPLKRNHNSFNYDPCITSVSALKSALYCYDHESGGSSDSDSGWPLCKSAPASTNLLGSFEESALNGRIKPFGAVDGFTLELGASGAFCPTHVTLPVTTLFFNVSDDNAPSPYFGLCSLDSVGRRGYYVPKKGSVQATLFNPQGTVVKMFVVRYDLCDMPASCQTFVRQRTYFMPCSASLRDAMENRSWLRYLIHLRFASSSSGKLFLHTDIRMLFSRKSELEAYNINCVDVGAAGICAHTDTYELRSFTEMPKEPKFSPRKFNRSDKERNIYK